MKILAPFFTSLVIAIWVVAIAIISVQNATPVSLKFLIFQSVQIPVGLVLAFSSGIGLMAMAVLQPLWGIAGSGGGRSRLEEDAEFFVDDEEF
ncbi:LapA family protein [Anabaena subtropica]|uniref:LapA family protein n=1 Tax=Anabaena subtropica FACHB-260 TaxID=2692884 RepID=A0ABR8CRS2_9NOST|nr:LapA family protein [Anabaena subtropica]MBD2345089.1 LapA family protein [Anabaena subtropica FACHB-260]